MVFLGERGQAKSRIIRGLTSLLDAYVPILRDAEIPENPFAPITPLGRRLAAERGDDLEIRWLAREERYAEKLATTVLTKAPQIVSSLQEFTQLLNEKAGVKPAAADEPT